MKTVISSHSDAIENSSMEIQQLLSRKPDAVLALSSGRSTQELYSKLVCMFKRGEISFSKVRVFAVTGYKGVPHDDERSSKSILTSQLLSLVDIKSENCHFLTEDDLDSYDKLIASAGGLDLAILGLGINGHIGFNAPATPYDTHTRCQQLTDVAKRQLAPTFNGSENVPKFGLTMGIKTLCDARNIIVLAFGEEKSEAVFNMLYGRDDSSVPAAFLQLPANVTAYVDEAAAAKL